MVVIIKEGADEEKLSILKGKLRTLGFDIHESKGVNSRLLGLVGDTSIIDTDYLMANDIVADVKRVQEPFKKANRKMHPEDTVIDIEGRKIGGGFFQVIAGPCSIETEEQITEVAKDVKESGATLLRGGAFKPRTSPYSFQGLQNDGLKLLLKAKEAVNLPIVTEIMTTEHLELFEDVDVVQVGARNMQNFQLLKALPELTAFRGRLRSVSWDHIRRLSGQSLPVLFLLF